MIVASNETLTTDWLFNFIWANIYVLMSHTLDELVHLTLDQWNDPLITKGTL